MALHLYRDVFGLEVMEELERDGDDLEDDLPSEEAKAASEQDWKTVLANLKELLGG